MQKVLEGIDAAAAAGLRVKVNAVVKRGANDDGIVALAEQFRGTGHTLRFIEYMDVGNTNGWRLDDVVSSDEIVATIGAVHPLEPRRGRPPRRDRPPLALPRRRRRDRGHRLGHEAVLRRLLAGPALAEGRLHTCLSRRKATICAPRSASGPPTRSSPSILRGIWDRRSDRYSELRTAETSPSRKSRCPTSGGECLSALPRAD